MSNPFATLKSDGLQESEDRLGGGFKPRDSGVYDMKIKLAFTGKSPNGALNVTVHLEDEKGDYRETIYITNRAGENFFLNKEDKTKKVPLPGFTVIDDLCLAANGLPLADQTFEEKTIKLYDYDAKKELPKAATVITSILGETVTVGLLQTLKNKGMKQADGSYVDGPEERIEVNISKVFHTESKMTMVEARQGKTEGEFYEQWVKKNTGYVKDERTIKGGAGGKAVGGPPVAGGSEGKPATKSLFGKKD